ncbi:MAG: RNA methyltransferase [Actinomycetota bacterium]|nr:RNA methyltransferase [Actinomycetota bacterium]
MRPAGPGDGSPVGLAIRNPRVQRLRRLARDPRARRAEGAYVVEGEKLVAAAIAADAPLEAVYVAPGYAGPLAGSSSPVGVVAQTLAPGVLERVSATVTPQPVIGVVTMVDTDMAALRRAVAAGAGPVVVCVDVRDPGNLGTVLRSAQAAGAAGIVCCHGTADAYAPKCVRASAGAVFQLPMVSGGSPVEVLEELGSWGMRRLGARAAGGTAYDTTDLTGPVALVLGNEAHGLSPELEALLDGLITIPMAAPAESLNVGSAAAIICFEAARQRRTRR